jgi:hypothetical protein
MRESQTKTDAVIYGGAAVVVEIQITAAVCIRRNYANFVLFFRNLQNNLLNLACSKN